MDKRYFSFFFRKKYWPLFLPAIDLQDALQQFERIRWKSAGHPFFERNVPEVEEYRHKYNGQDAHPIKPINYELTARHIQTARHEWHTVQLSQSKCTENLLFLVEEGSRTFEIVKLSEQCRP